MAIPLNLRVTRDRPRPPGEGRDPLLSALPFAAAIVDSDGTIRAANRIWVEGDSAPACGESYLRFQDDRNGGPSHPSTVSVGVRAVLSGRAPDFTGNAAAGTGPEPGTIRVFAVPYGGPGCAMVMHQPVQPEEEQSLQSQRMEAVGRMVGSVAHDFANLLTLIAGYSEVLLKRLGDRDPVRAELEEIRKAASRGSRLTSQLLGFTRGHAVEPRLLDLNALVVDLEGMLRPIAGEHIELETVLAPDLGMVLADAGQMEQVIVNLVLNARDAMPSGGRLTIETSNHELSEQEARQRSAAPGPVVQLRVTDTGHGMNANTLSRLFEPFFTTKEKGKGTGLGLSTVHNIVGASHGQVWAASLPGHGSAFTIWLPRANQAPAAPVAVPARRPGAAAGGDETILLVEDEDGVRRLLMHILGRRGYRVLEAPNAEEALQIFEKVPGEIDLLLTDIVMPRMNGRELADHLRGLRPDLEVMYMSGYTDEVLFRTGALGPGMSFLQKPLRPEVLEARVREALDRRPKTGSKAG